MRLDKIQRYGWSWDKRPRRGICNIFNCNNLHYANGFCHNHYGLNRRNGKPEYKASYGRTCCVLSCEEEATPLSVFCEFHLMRQRRGVSVEIPKGKAFSGERNPRWNGGTSEYPNHSEMKRIRKEVLKEANNICYYCGGYTNQIHHKDLSKDNHTKENLVACCHKCNHLPEHRTSKFRRLYGHTYKELIEMGLFKNYRQIPAY